MCVRNNVQVNQYNTIYYDYNNALANLNERERKLGESSSSQFGPEQVYLYENCTVQSLRERETTGE